jgi:hypothetical protein
MWEDIPEKEVVELLARLPDADAQALGTLEDQ